MSDLLEKAREDLGALPPATWTVLYGARLLDELAVAERTLTAHQVMVGKMGSYAVVLGAAGEAFKMVMAALQAFQLVTGFTGEKRLKPTATRWHAACILAIATRRAAEGFLTSCRPHLATISGTPRGQAQKPDAVLQGILGEAERNAANTPEIIASLKVFRDRVERLREHPVWSDPAVLAAGGVPELVAQRGQCESRAEDGRCWFYLDHPGDHQHQKERTEDT